MPNTEFEKWWNGQQHRGGAPPSYRECWRAAVASERERWKHPSVAVINDKSGGRRYLLVPAGFSKMELAASLEDGETVNLYVSLPCFLNARFDVLTPEE